MKNLLPNRRALYAASAAGAVVLSSLLLIDGPAQSAAPALPVLATGTITFPAGTTSGQVLAFAQPDQVTIAGDSSSAPLATPLIASTEAAADGSFTLALDPSVIPASAVNDGNVNVMATAVSGGQQQEFFFPVKLGSTAAGKTAFVSTSTATKPATPNLRFNMRSGVATNTKYDPAQFRTESGRIWKPAAMKAVVADTSVPVTRRLARIAASVTDPVDAIPICYVVPGDKSYGHPEHFMNVYTDNNDTTSANVSEGASSDHSLGVAVRAAGGSWSESGSSSISRSASVSSTSANRQRSWAYWNKVNYQIMSNSCTGRQSKGPIGFYDILAGDLDGAVSPYFTTGSCGVKLKGDQWNTGGASSVTFGAGVDIGPISVSAQSGFGSSENIHYTFLRKGEIAGNSAAGPVNSSKVEADMFWTTCTLG